MSKRRVLMVCLGNICRSPAAEGVLRRLLDEAGLTDRVTVDSAGTGGWHEGDGPDNRMIAHARARGYDLSQLEARQIRYPEDYQGYDYILTMDESNLKNVRALDVQALHHGKIRPLTSFCTIHDVREVPDPYHGGADGFEYVLDLIEDACRALVERLKAEVA